MSSPKVPTLKKCFASFPSRQVKEHLKGQANLIGFGGLQSVSRQPFHGLLLFPSEIRGIFQIQTARLFEIFSCFRFFTTNLVYSEVQDLHHMKAVKGNLSIRTTIVDTLDIHRQHINTGLLDLIRVPSMSHQIY